MPLTPLLDRNKRLKEFGQEEPNRDEEHGHVGDDEADDGQRVVAHGVEGRVGKAHDDGQDGAGDVAQQRAPEDGDAPVFAGGDDYVEVAGELAALLVMVSGWLFALMLLIEERAEYLPGKT